MAEARTVQQFMEAEGLYKEGSKADLQGQYIDEETIEIAGKSYTLSKISYWDSKVFTNEMDTILARQNPLIHDVFARNAVAMFDAVRMANANSKQGYKGAGASGNELDATLFMARQFYDPDVSGTKRTTWVRTIGSTGAKWFFEGTTTTSELTMGEEEALVWLAFYNPSASPCVDAFQITMNTEPYDLQDLDFEQVQVEQGDVIIEFKEPWTLPPEQSGKIQAYYFRTGTDEMRPLGIWIKMARNLRTLTSP